MVFAHREDIAVLGYRDGDHVDLVTRWDGDERVRCASGFRLVVHDVPRGTATAYYPGITSGVLTEVILSALKSLERVPP